MSLSRTHEEYIETCIGHLFDFPTDPEKLKIEIKNILATFAEIETLKTNPYYQLKVCFTNPTKQFRRLEGQGGAPTVEDVQTYILILIEKNLENAAHHAGQTLEQLGYQKIPFEVNSSTLFKSEEEDETDDAGSVIQKDESTGYYHFKTYPNFLYTLSVEINKNKIYLHINYQIQKKEVTKKIFFEKITRRFNLELEKAQYVYDNFYRLYGLALKYSTNYLTYKLFEKKRCKNKKYVGNEFGACLLIHPYYFTLLESGHLSEQFLTDVEAWQVDILLHPNIITLIKKEFITIDHALTMRPHETKILLHPFYFNFLINNFQHVMLFAAVQAEKSHFLMNPMCTNLIIANKITVEIAFLLPNHVAEFISNEFYYQRILKITPNWNNLVQLQKKFCDILLTDHAMHAILDHDITSDMIFHHPEQALDYVFLFQNHHVQFWAQHGLIKATELSSPSLKDAMLHIYVKRVSAILNGNPCSILGRREAIRAKIDTIEDVMRDFHDLTIFESNQEIEATHDFLLGVLAHIFLKISAKLQRELQEGETTLKAIRDLLSVSIQDLRVMQDHSEAILYAERKILNITQMANDSLICQKESHSPASEKFGHTLFSRPKVINKTARKMLLSLRKLEPLAKTSRGFASARSPGPH